VSTKTKTDLRSKLQQQLLYHRYVHMIQHSTSTEALINSSNYLSVPPRVKNTTKLYTNTTTYCIYERNY